MKWIFFTLILLNGFYFSWNWYLTEIANAPTVSKVENNVVAPKVIVQDVAAIQAVSINTCLIFGEIEDVEAAESLRRTLFANGFKTELIKRKEQTKVQHTVYIAPFLSEMTAWQQLKSLQTQGIDSSIITSGALKNGISLGVYGNLSNAKRIYKKYKHLGDVKIQRETWENSLYWVKLSSEDTQKLEQVNFLGGSDIFQGVKKQKKNCDATLD